MVWAAEIVASGRGVCTDLSGREGRLMAMVHAREVSDVLNRDLIHVSFCQFSDFGIHTFFDCGPHGLNDGLPGSHCFEAAVAPAAA